MKIAIEIPDENVERFINIFNDYNFYLDGEEKQLNLEILSKIINDKVDDHVQGLFEQESMYGVEFNKIYEMISETLEKLPAKRTRKKQAI